MPPFGSGRPVAARNLFSDRPLALSNTELPSPSTAILSGLENLPIAAEARSFLAGLHVETGLPLLFGAADEDGYHHQLRARSATVGRGYTMLLAPDTPTPPHVESIGKVVGLRVVRVDPSRPGVANWLEAVGIPVTMGASFAWIGDPELEQHRPIRRFFVGDTLAFEASSPSESPLEVVLAEPDGNRSSIVAPRGSVLGVFAPSQVGRHSIEYGSGDAMQFDVIEAAEYEPLLTVHIEAGLGSISELAAGAVTLRFESAATVQEERLELALVSGTRELARATTDLPDTPCRLAGDHPVWEVLLSAQAKDEMLECETATLRITVGRIAGAQFTFERVYAPFEWRRNDRNEWEAHDEAGVLPVLSASAEAPLLIEAYHPIASPDIVLLRAGRGEPAGSGGSCIGPRIWRSGAAPAIRPPDRLPRRLEVAPSERAPGARTVVDALIAWSAATVDHPVTQYRRGQVLKALTSWTVEQFCGSLWLRQEADLRVDRAVGFGPAFLQSSRDAGAGFQNVALNNQQQAQLDRILLRLVAERLVWIATSPSIEPVSDALAETLDATFNDAYGQLARDLGSACPFNVDEDIDAGAPAETWNSVIVAARRTSLFPELADLLRPLSAGDELMTVEFEGMAPDETVEYFTGWIRRHRPQQLARAWSGDLVGAAYWIFARPAVASRFPWREAAQRLLADRFTARALRYAALRAGGTGQ